MKKGQIEEGIALKTEFGGRGVVSSESGEYIVKNVLKGQKIRFRVRKPINRKIGREYGEGVLLEILERSPDEISPDCPHFGECGGCSLRTLPYEKQLELKEEQVRSLLDRCCPDPCFEGIHASPVVQAYRNKMEFTFGDAYKDGPLTLGLHKTGSSYDIITVSECRIVDEDFRSILISTLNTAGKSSLPFYKRNTHIGYFRHLLVRKAYHTEEILIDLVTSSQIQAEQEQDLLENWKNAINQLPLKGKIAGILHTVNDSPADVVRSDRTDILQGNDYFHEELLGLRFRITPFSFFQNNSTGAELLYSIVREYVGDTSGKNIFDLYSGTGTIAQILAPVAAHVTGVEIVPEAVEAARRNAEYNGLTNCTFINGDVLKVLDELTEKPDVIILDPPREGVHPKALSKIAAYGANHIVYISCKPVSMPGDLAILRAAGYQVTKSCCVDMFCGTAHTETVALLERVRS